MSALPRVRALGTGPAFWVAMLAASAFGTNLGDFAVDDAGLSRWGSFALLSAICAVAVVGDRWAGLRTQAFYWVALVALRAGATNVADALTHEFKLDYLLLTCLLGMLALAAGAFTRAPPGRVGAPVIDGTYWLAMLVAGVFGTTGGDMAAHDIGLPTAAALLTLVLVVVIGLRARIAPGAPLAYWCVVLAERAAGTPLGDGLANRHGFHLGLPLAMVCTGGALLVALGWREWLRRRQQGGVVVPA